MKNLYTLRIHVLNTKAFLLISAFLLTSYLCQAQDPLKEEYEKIEETRQLFMRAMKEKRYNSFPEFATADMKAVGPATDGWQKMRELGKERGIFPYDSIRMFPQETVILSDTVAYDFGTSKVYYTDEKGNVVTLQDTFLVLLKKTEDGKWKMFREVASGMVK